MLMSILYPWSYVATFIGLLGWTLFADRKALTSVFRGFFFLGFVVWLAVLLITEVPMAIKLSIAFRDLIVVGLAATILGQSRSNKMVALVLTLGAGLFMQQYYLPILKNTFKSKTVSVGLSQNGELLVEINDHNQISSLRAILEPMGATIKLAFKPGDPTSTELDDYYLVDLPSSVSQARISALKKELLESPVVDWIEENEVIEVQPDYAITKTRKNPKVAVNDPKATDQWALQALNVFEVHQLLQDRAVKSKKTAHVVILDTGVDGQHEDLVSNYYSIDEKYDKDINGHGTHVAGIVAATTNNQIGVASMITEHAPLKISGIKVLSDAGFGSQAKIIQGMIQAADSGADVISMSLGGPSSDKKQIAYERATKYCADKGAIVVVAAGNASVNAKSYSPANTPGVIAVTAVNETLKKTGFSNEVQDLEMGVAAPGENILSTFPRNQYRSLKGTSMAAPFVSSVIGLLKSISPDITAQQAYDILTETGKDSDHTLKTGKIIQPLPALQNLVVGLEE